MLQLSVIVPVYNAERYLKRCVNSICCQTFKNLEIILIDDGSSDKSPKLCDEFKKNDLRIKVLHQNNKGVGAARNKGLELCSGDYITFVDSDDFLDPVMYDNMMFFADKYACDLVMCDCLKEYRDHVEQYSHDIREGYYNRYQLEKEYFPHLLVMPNVEYPATISNYLCLCKKSVIEANHLRYVEGIRYSEDLLFGAEMIYYSNSFYYLKGKYYYHYNCTNSQSATHVQLTDKWQDYRILYSKIKERFEDSGCKCVSDQLDKVLLLFVYNAVGYILKNEHLSRLEKRQRAKEILSTTSVREIFKRIKIAELPIPFKQKVLTWGYKTGIGLNILINKYSE